LNTILVWKDYEKLNAFGREIDVTCLVRNELGTGRMLREKNEVMFTFCPDGRQLPYMPRRFPKGTWDITKVEKIKNPEIMAWEKDGQWFAKEIPGSRPVYYMKWWKIWTDAHQLVHTWSTIPGEKGPLYDHPNDEVVQDTGYLIHGSDSITTVGCGRGINEPDLDWLALKIIDGRANDDSFQLEVI